ncbi:MAG: hypothetical protein ACYC0Z_11310 [Acidobacteriaceae bacterium]
MPPEPFHLFSNVNPFLRLKNLGMALGYLLLGLSLYSLSSRAQQLTRRISRPLLANPLFKRLDVSTKQQGPYTLQAGVPLWIQLDHGYPMRTGTTIQGSLMADIYAVNHVLLPEGSTVLGHIVATPGVSRSVRRHALMDGDFTPLKQPTVRFDAVILPDGRHVAMSAPAVERSFGLVQMRSAGAHRNSIFKTVRDGIHSRASAALGTFTRPQKADRFRRFAYSQLPWHPQEVWSGTQFVAELAGPVTIAPATDEPDPVLPQAELSPETLKKLLPNAILEARLTEDLSSATSKQGDPVDAILTKPVYDAQHTELIFPEGTHLKGVVLRAKPARSFGRTGTLRFTFRSIQPPAGTAEAVEGQLAAIDGQKGQNVTVDSEGGTKANPDKNRFLAPITLALLAGHAGDKDGGAGNAAVAGNGFGLATRILAIASVNHNYMMGLAYYALSKSLYHRWIARGQNIDFPRDTRLQIAMAEH